MTKILFLADTTHHTGAVKDHINAITAANEGFAWYVENPLKNKVLDKLDLNYFDAVGIHYSIKPYNNYYLSTALKRKIAEFRGVKFQFLQDEYQRVNMVQDYLAQLGFDILFTLVNPALYKAAYPDKRLKNLKMVTVLTGYVAPEMTTYNPPPIAARPIDVSYRARRCDFWLGALSYEKQWIGDAFLRYTKNAGLITDISMDEKARIYGQDWIGFLQQSKVVLGTESGASIWDFDGSIETRVNEYLAQHKKANFDEVHKAVLEPIDGKILYNAISPRVFEAAANKTAMLMFPGYYSGVLIPDRHYISLEKDFSNIEEVMNKIRDAEFLQKMVDVTYDEIIASGTYDRHALTDCVIKAVSDALLDKGWSSQSANIDMPIYLQGCKKRYKRQNQMRLVVTELCFIIQNINKLLFDKRRTGFEKLHYVYQQGRRYLTYIVSRVGKRVW